MICDIGLPQMSGYELLRMVREHVPSRLPAIALSGYVRREDRERAMAAGFDVYLTKPLDPDDLVREAARVLHGAGATRGR